MARSVFFDNFTNFNEQSLLEDLIVESIKIYGHDLYYCPRTLVAKDEIYGEDAVSEYNSNYLIEMYIKSFDSYEGDGTFLSKFNLEIRDQMRFVVARRIFDEEVGSTENLIRPREGDLIYSDMMKRLFVIMYVNDKPSFYQLGALQTYELTCEVFEYSNERLNTGIQEIDDIENKYSFAPDAFGVLDTNGTTIVDSNGQTIVQGDFSFDEQLQDTYADNDEFEQENETDGIVDFTEFKL